MSIREFQLDTQKVIDAIMGTPVSNELARENASPLIESWISTHLPVDLVRKVKAVELGFQIWLTPQTLIVGVQDAIFEDEQGALGGEWKTKSAPRMTKAGQPYKGDTEADWLEDISNGPQLAIYALALHRGLYYTSEGHCFSINADNPRIMVRAAVKSNPPMMWPQESSGIFEFPNAILKSVEDALLNKAESIRAMRKSGRLPWQLPGKHCYDWGRYCQFRDECLTRQYRKPKQDGIFNLSDPAAQAALSHVPPEQITSELVVLGASAYNEYSRCAELGRIMYGGLGPKEESLALDTGSCFHQGIASYYSQLMEWQNNSTK